MGASLFEAAGSTTRAAYVSAALACAAIVLGVGAVRGDQQAAPAEIDAPAFGVLAQGAPPGFVGSQACAGCHAAEAAAWQVSQHARAMQPATDATVLGDFDGAHAEHFGSKAGFFRKNGRFVVETEGADGKPAEFPVDYTFGIEPLQQYLTTMPDGRVQALPFAWDTRTADKGGQHWFHLYPKEAIPPGDALHWTGALQNWNYMCADCHSTSVQKNYDAAANRFATTYSEVSVGCEACHGAGQGHVTWANGAKEADVPNKGFASVAAKRPAPDWFPDPVTGSPAHGVTRPPGDEVETCGVCHSRRGQFAEGWQPGKPLADFYRPVFLSPDLFEDDGQMRDEVFNYASFQQSKMFAKGVVCSDCHDPHSGKLKAEGSKVCSQCHMPQRFASVSHTGHTPGTNSPDCIACHMPERTYMVVDGRHDHSFRIPRPDLSEALETPNTCASCHADKPASWAAAAIERWHGPERKGFQTYAPAFHMARTGGPDARRLLLNVVQQPATPALARASALQFLRSLPSQEVAAVAAGSLSDPDPMVRVAALGNLSGLPRQERWRQAGALLSDPVRLVRMEAATVLAEGPPADVSPEIRHAFDRALDEYIASERYNADRSESRSNLAHLLIRRGSADQAEREYLAAIALSPAVAPRVDLADLYRAMGREADAERVLREAIQKDPAAAAPWHALGLALVRAKRYDEAIDALKRAVELAPGEARYAYVYAVALSSTGKPNEARAVLERAAAADPADTEVLSGLLQDALQRGDYRPALSYAERLHALLPDDSSLAPLIANLRQAVATSPAN